MTTSHFIRSYPTKVQAQAFIDGVRYTDNSQDASQLVVCEATDPTSGSYPFSPAYQPQVWYQVLRVAPAAQD